MLLLTKVGFVSPSQDRVSYRERWPAAGAAYFGMAGPVEFAVAAALLALLVVYKLISIGRLGFDSDEPQHLHVIWGWARGFVQYRDVFDNHMPLFQIMFAPIFGLVGDGPNIVPWMRTILFPVFLVTLWCTYELGTLLFSRRAGAWAALLFGWFIGSFHLLLEFRTDNVWVTFWLLCLIALVRGPLTPRRALAAGLLMSFCFAISLKSSLLLISITAAALAMALLFGRAVVRESWKHIALCLLAFLGTTLLIPAIIAGWFAFHGLWADFRYGVFDHNAIWRMDAKHQPPGSVAILPLGLAVACVTAWWIFRGAPDASAGAKRAFVWLVCGFYMAVLRGAWRLITRQDYLPWDPLVAIFLTAGLFAMERRLTNSARWPGRLVRSLPLPAYVCFVELLVVATLRPVWHDPAAPQRQMLGDLLRITDPGDYIIDPKGEGIFRQRASHAVMETVTLTRIKRGSIKDDVAQGCQSTRAGVAILGRYSDAGMEFIQQHYVPVTSRLAIAGAILPRVNREVASSFEIAIPGEYQIVARDRTSVTGSLDGEPYDGTPRLLSIGKHTFLSASDRATIGVFWAKAAERHFTPFEQESTAHQ